jgi:transposase InsO family protein
MDFITDLPPSRWRGQVFNSILVIVDRFTKMARYIPVHKTIDAAELADIYMDYIFKDFGAPKGITSDRGSVFTSKFWSTFAYYLSIRRRLSTAFHPQTDGQTERIN